MRVPRRRWAWVGLLFFALIGRAPAQGVRIYEPAFAWEHPDLAGALPENLVFTDPDTRHYSARSYFAAGLTRDGYCWIVQVFHWRYAWFDGWGIAVVVGDAVGTSFVSEGGIRGVHAVETADAVSIRFASGSFAQEGPTSRIVLDLDGFQCDLAMRSLLPPWTPGDGYAILTDKGDVYLRRAVPAPVAEATGWLRIADRTISGEGWSFADRSLTVAPPSRLDFGGCGLRLFGSPFAADEAPRSVVLLEYVAIGASMRQRVPMLLATRGGEWLFATREYRLDYDDLVLDAASSLFYPRRIRLSAVGGGYALEGEFLVERLIATSDVFSHVPVLFRGILARFLAQPVVFRMVGRFVGTLTGSDGSVETFHLAGEGEYFTVR